MGLLTELSPQHAPASPAQAAAEEAFRALDQARPGRVRLILAGALTGPASAASPQEPDLMALDEVVAGAGRVPVDLVLQSAGASFEVAEEVLRRLRARASHLAVLVPRRVRGGLSLLACLADELVLGTRGVVHAPLPSLPVAGRVVPADLGRQEGARDPSGAARAGAALDHVRRQLSEGLVRWHGMRAEDASHIAEQLTSTPALGLPGRALAHDDLSRLGLPLPALSSHLAQALDRLDRALQACLPPGGHWVLGPGGAVLRPATGARPPNHAAGAAGGKPAVAIPEVPAVATVAVFEVRCECGAVSKVQANLDTSSPLQDGHWAYPPDGVFLCPECMDRKDLEPLRRQVEEKTHRKVVT